MTYRAVKPIDFVGKTVADTDSTSVNTVKFTFTDGGTLTLWAEVAVSTPAGNISGIFVEDPNYMDFVQFKEFLVSWGLDFTNHDGKSSTIPYPAVYSRMMDDAISTGGQKLADLISTLTHTTDDQTSLAPPTWDEIFQQWNKVFP